MLNLILNILMNEKQDMDSKRVMIKLGFHGKSTTKHMNWLLHFND